MIVITCAWCSHYIGENDDGNPTYRVSHGICPGCLVKVEADYKAAGASRVMSARSAPPLSETEDVEARR